MSNPAVQEDEFDEVSGSAWAKFANKGDTAIGIFQEFFVKPARDQFPEQIVAVLTDAMFNGEVVGTLNVGIPMSNARYANSIKSFIPGHKVKIILKGFYNQDTETLSDVPGKTKKGKNFAKNYGFGQLPNVDPSYQSKAADEAFSDIPDFS